MSQIPNAPRGTFDILPDAVGAWQELEGRTREVLSRHGFAEIRTPVFEETGLFERSVGETTDIVEKEMYTFGGENHREFALRPEMTASSVRAYLQYNFHKTQPRQKWFYIGPNFRHERPQKGRFRQFHQIGIESFGTLSPKADAEIVAAAAELYSTVGIQRYDLVINTLGDRECRPKYRAAVQELLRPRREKLCGQCQTRLERNVFRVLDCKNPECAKVTTDVPPITDYLNDVCRRDYDEWKTLLAKLGVTFREDPRLVRGLDYYGKAVFEFMSGDLGAQASIGGGGRYDALLTDFGAPDAGATGFATGMERILMVQEAQSPGALKRPPPKPAVFFIVIEGDGIEAREQAGYRAMFDLRRRGIAADMEYERRSVKAQFRAADRAGARLAAILGPEEFRAGQVKLKSFADGSEWQAPLDGLAASIAAALATAAS